MSPSDRAFRGPAARRRLFGAPLVAIACLIVGCAREATSSPPPPTTVADSIPVDVTVEGTKAIKDAQPVRIRATAHAGSAIYGFEAFLCNGGTTYRRDSDIRPTIEGKCAADSLSPDSDAYKEVRSPPPYESVEETFRPGVGTNTFTKRDGTPATVTCDRAHPCELVLKVQFPDGFAFRAYPLTYS